MFQTPEKLSWWEENVSHPFISWWKDLKFRTWGQLVAFFQRGHRGWANCDIWSLDWYLAGWFPKALRRLAATTHSYPGWPEKDNPDYKEVGTYENWIKTLEQMADGFQAFIDMEDFNYDQKDEKARKRLWKKYQKGMRLFAKYFPHLWD